MYKTPPSISNPHPTNQGYFNVGSNRAAFRPYQLGNQAQPLFKQRLYETLRGSYLRGFKQVNDTYGHEAGDHLLKQFSTILTDSVRKDDVVVRLGGEEFLVVLKNTDPEYIHTFAKKLLDAVAQTPFNIGDGVHIRKTCSIGYTVFPFYAEHPDLLSFEQGVMLSDMAMYYAKHHGRNQAVYFSETANVPEGEENIRHMMSSFDYAQKQSLIKLTQIHQAGDAASSS